MPKRRRCNNQNQSRSLQPGKKSKNTGSPSRQTIDETIDTVAFGSQSDTSLVCDSLDSLDYTDTQGSRIEQLSTDITTLKETIKQQQDTIKQQQDTIAAISTQLDFILSFLDIPKPKDPPQRVSSASINNSDQQADLISFSSTSWPPLTTTDNDHAANNGDFNSRTKLPAWQSVTSHFRRTVAAVIHSEQRAAKSKANNFIISGLPISSTTSDKDRIVAICQRDLGVAPVIKYCRRLGTPSATSVQKLLVVTDSQVQASEIISRAKLLRRSTELTVKKHVYINADLTKSESKVAFEERQRRREAIRAGTWYPTNTSRNNYYSSHGSATTASFFDFVNEAGSFRSSDDRTVPDVQPVANHLTCQPPTTTTLSAFAPAFELPSTLVTPTTSVSATAPGISSTRSGESQPMPGMSGSGYDCTPPTAATTTAAEVASGISMNADEIPTAQPSSD